ncbi:MAG: hypothetical protein F6K30_25150 [Cyanothece sp. SIO2G6]|nr:hypothetical protein [Cyanothece sp. SIO2G6]
MTPTQYLRLCIVASVMLCLSGCGLFASAPPPEDPVEPTSPTQTPTEEPDDIEALDETEPDPTPTPVPDNVQAYQDPNGFFALAFPEGYNFEPSEQGLTFLSEDGGFAGEIVYQVSEKPSNDMLNLEKALKAHIDPQFPTIEWQRAGQRQPDGSVRLAWTGEDESGRDIDALSFIEVRGQITFILSLYAIDQEYNTYAEDARIIAGTYVVRSAESEEAEDSGDSEDSDDTESGDSPEGTEDADDTTSEDNPEMMLMGRLMMTPKRLT